MAAAKYSSQYISDRFLPDKARALQACMAFWRRGAGGWGGSAMVSAGHPASRASPAVHLTIIRTHTHASTHAGD